MYIMLSDNTIISHDISCNGISALIDGINTERIGPTDYFNGITTVTAFRTQRENSLQQKIVLNSVAGQFGPCDNRDGSPEVTLVAHDVMIK